MKSVETCSLLAGAARRATRFGIYALPLFVAAATLSLPLAARAGTVTSVGSIVGPGLGFIQVPFIGTPSEGNDNQPGGPGTDGNITVPIKRFDHTGYIDLQFNVVDSNPTGTTEYAVFESVDNNTGVDWNLYTIVLGFGVGNNFVMSPAGDGLDFDAPDYNTAPNSTVFSSVSLNEDILVFSGGLHQTGAQSYEFRVDVPDGITSFTLRQIPRAVPEPGTLVLAGTALVGLALSLRRKRR